MTPKEKLDFGRFRRADQERTICQYVDVPPFAMYDLGVGIYSEWHTLKHAYPHMALIGCEPHPDEFRELLSVFDGRLAQAAIGEEAGTATFHLTPLGSGGGSLYHQAGDDARPTVEVPVWTLDQFDEWAGRPDRILLWMDIEGSEMAAIRGGHSLLSSGRVHWVNLETRDARLTDHYATRYLTADYDAALAAFGYRRVCRYNVQGTHAEAPGDCI